MTTMGKYFIDPFLNAFFGVKFSEEKLRFDRTTIHQGSNLEVLHGPTRPPFLKKIKRSIIMIPAQLVPRGRIGSLNGNGLSRKYL